MSFFRRTTNQPETSPRFPFRKRFSAPEVGNFIRRSRTDFAGISQSARNRDRNIILDELKADEEPEYLPIRKALPPIARPAPPAPEPESAPPPSVTGWQFVANVRADPIPPRLPALLHPLWLDIELEFDYDNYAENGWMYLAPNGVVRVQPYKEAQLGEWNICLQHLLFHIALNFLMPPPNHPHPFHWLYAAEMLINRQVANTPFLRLPPNFPNNAARPNIFNQNRNQSIPQTPDDQIELWKKANRGNLPQLDQWATPAGEGRFDVVETSLEAVRRLWAMYQLQKVKETCKPVSKNRHTDGVIARAYRWVETSFPLLSAVTSEFTLDYDQAAEYNIVLGAVSANDQVIFVNPDATISELEWRWVLIHEILHVVLEHHQRRQERHHLLWNVACDYVINNWLETMGVGMRPEGVLFKPEYAGRDAESIYEELLENGGNDEVKLVTLRGEGMGDILDFDSDYKPQKQSQSQSIFGRPRRPAARQTVQNNAKRMLEQPEGVGGRYRGDLPADLIEELQLSHLLSEEVEVPKWEAELAQWLELQLTPKVLTRSYTRLSRRQMAAPNIPLAGRAYLGLHSPTFGVILDTSGSMSNELLQKGLAAVVAFSEQHGVVAIRLVMCDTRPYDEGFIPLENLKKPYKVYGRGGTTLQPSVDLLEQAEDFPATAPILVVTDGAIDHIVVGREHAYLLPGNGNLPFEPQGPVFQILGDNPSSFGRGSFNRSAQPNNNPFRRSEN